MFIHTYACVYIIRCRTEAQVRGVGAKMSRPRHFLLTLHYTKVYDAQDT